MRFLTFVVLSLTFLTTSAVAQLPGEGRTIKIGVIVPLSGDMAVHGQEIERAMKLALKETAAQSLAYRYDLIFEDNQLQPTKSASDGNSSYAPIVRVAVETERQSRLLSEITSPTATTERAARNTH